MRLYAREIHEELPPFCRKFCTGWAVGLVKSGKEEECCWPVCSQVEVRNELLDLKTNREDLGVHKYWVLLAVVKEYRLLRFNKQCAFT